MMLDVLDRNRYINKSIQKGFWKGINGIPEHTELLAHLPKEAKRKQRSITITLLDLKTHLAKFITTSAVVVMRRR